MKKDLTTLVLEWICYLLSISGGIVILTLDRPAWMHLVAVIMLVWGSLKAIPMIPLMFDKE